MPTHLVVAALCFLCGSIYAQSSVDVFADDFESALVIDDAFRTPESVARFMTQATFGPTPDDFEDRVGASASEWFNEQLELPITFAMPQILELRQRLDIEAEEFGVIHSNADDFAFWRSAFAAPDQLRQRMAFALSQILVVSDAGGEVLTDISEAMGYYNDILLSHAFGNYRELLEDITYSPAMGYYLTFMGNRKADVVIGSVPDENYAREILQLFSIGLVQLNPDGTVILEGGQPVETYTNQDITELAAIFTALDLDLGAGFDVDIDYPYEQFAEAWSRPMQVIPDRHGLGERTFLGQTVPAGGTARQRIDRALDIIFDHPNLAPFIGRQIIQRLVTSHPSAAYIGRVSAAFNTGRFVLPNETVVGSGRRGDLAATAAAVLFDPEARNSAPRSHPAFGKLREPILRLTAWGRAFDVQEVTPEYFLLLWDTSESEALAQHPQRARSVFNFYRPGYVAAGTEAGDRGLTTPEFQLVNSTTVPGYVNSMGWIVDYEMTVEEVAELAELFELADADLDPDLAYQSFIPDYQQALALASDTEALIDHLALRLNYGVLSDETCNRIASVIDLVEDEYERTTLAIWMVLTAPDFLIQR